MRKETEEKVFTNWTVKEMIGQGAFGKVYRIEREEFGNLYQAAMKKIVIPQSKEDIEDAINEGMDDKSVTSYFQSLVEEIVGEFRLMSQLKGHTNIVSYEDHMVIPHDDGFSWDILIRMELLKSLKNAIAENSLTQEDVIKLGIGICSALEVCGKKNIIHRDIKPENIFVTEFGEYKLGDFGIARTAEKTMSNLSKKGTYTYMAPEIYKGEAYNATVDIYSLGLVMYRLMNNNRAPFLPAYPQPISFSDREESLTKRISNAPMPAPAGGSKELQRIILKACAYSVSARYQNPAEMRDDLQKLLKDMEETNASEPLPVQVNSSADEDDTTVTVAGNDAPAKPAVEEDDTVSMFGTRTESAEETKSEPKAAPPAEPKSAASEPVIEEEAEDETVSMFTSRTESAPEVKSEPKAEPEKKEMPPGQEEPTQKESAQKKRKSAEKTNSMSERILLGQGIAIGILGMLLLVLNFEYFLQLVEDLISLDLDLDGLIGLMVISPLPCAIVLAIWWKVKKKGQEMTIGKDRKVDRILPKLGIAFGVLYILYNVMTILIDVTYILYRRGMKVFLSDYGMMYLSMATSMTKKVTFMIEILTIVLLLWSIVSNAGRKAQKK